MTNVSKYCHSADKKRVVRIFRAHNHIYAFQENKQFLIYSSKIESWVYLQGEYKQWAPFFALLMHL